MIWNKGWSSQFVSENYWRGGWRGKVANFFQRFGNAQAAFNNEHEAFNKIKVLEAIPDVLRKHDTDMLLDRAKQLKQMGGEEWAIGELVERAIAVLEGS